MKYSKRLRPARVLVAMARFCRWEGFWASQRTMPV
jgi:hypothetical protein